ncbi:pyridoxamine 5'-phosphate oxidase family protein [Georgenia sunbinii]|uniref:pyridoxamine 5'-phosphate oxidase family protein n=1 Tax=Georgenia sunbinii TaxID=3117728 RepID=UPI002F26333E
MDETPAELAALDELLTASRRRGTSHLREIIDGATAPTATVVVRRLTGMKVLSLATVTARGEPRISAVDGHFLHGSWTFGTSGAAAKARHLERRPAVSVAHVDGESFAVFSHGTAERLQPGDHWFGPTIEHWTAHYGSSPLTWGEDIRMYRLIPTWMVAYQPAG